MARNRNYDIIRGVSIIMVICIHCMMPLKESLVAGSFSLSNWICAFYYALISAGVPMFFMLSGALLLNRQETCSMFYKKRFKRILIPFIIWSIIVYSLSAVLQPKENLLFYCKNFFTLFFTTGVNEAYWFVYMLCGFYLLTPLCKMVIPKIKHPGIGLLLFIGIYLVGFYISLIVPEANVGCRWLCYFCLYMVGYFCHQVQFKNLKYGWMGVFLILIAYTICSVYSVMYIPWTLIYSILLFICLNQISCSPSNDDAITMLSRNGYGIYLSHVIFCGILMRVPFYIQYVPLCVLPILTTTIVVGIEYVMMRVIEKIGLNRYLC